MVHLLGVDSSPRCADDGVDRNVDGDHLGVVLGDAVHGAQNTLAGGYQDSYRAVQTVHPTWLRLSQSRHN